MFYDGNPKDQPAVFIFFTYFIQGTLINWTTNWLKTLWLTFWKQLTYTDYTLLCAVHVHYFKQISCVNIVDVLARRKVINSVYVIFMHHLRLMSAFFWINHDRAHDMTNFWMFFWNVYNLEKCNCWDCNDFVVRIIRQFHFLPTNFIVNFIFINLNSISIARVINVLILEYYNYITDL